MKHLCKEFEENKGRTYGMKMSIPNYGPAISRIEYVKEHLCWVAHCDEYATAINYCPFCGEKLQ